MNSLIVMCGDPSSLIKAHDHAAFIALEATRCMTSPVTRRSDCSTLASVPAPPAAALRQHCATVLLTWPDLRCAVAGAPVGRVGAWLDRPDCWFWRSRRRCPDQTDHVAPRRPASRRQTGQWWLFMMNFPCLLIRVCVQYSCDVSFTIGSLAVWSYWRLESWLRYFFRGWIVGRETVL